MPADCDAELVGAAPTETGGCLTKRLAGQSLPTCSRNPVVPAEVGASSHNHIMQRPARAGRTAPPHRAETFRFLGGEEGSLNWQNNFKVPGQSRPLGCQHVDGCRSVGGQYTELMPAVLSYPRTVIKRTPAASFTGKAGSFMRRRWG